MLVTFVVYFFPAHMLWYFLGLIGVCERLDLIEALLWLPDAFMLDLSFWPPFLFDAVVSGLLWVGILKLCGVKL